MTKLSIAIITKNEEANIKRCLESIKWADEIIVVDDYSVDKTAEIARSFTSKVILKKMERFGAQRQFALEEATNEWILALDADQIVTSSLKEEISGEISQQPNFSAYYVPVKNIFFGKWMKHSGLYPDYTLHLFRKDRVRYDNAYVHEKLIVSGKIGYLKNPIIHFANRDIAQYFSRFNLYTSLTARKLYEQGLRLRWYNFFSFFIFKPVYYCLKKLLWDNGFLDGFHGFIYSLFNGFTALVYYAKLWERQNRGKFKDGMGQL